MKNLLRSLCMITGTVVIVITIAAQRAPFTYQDMLLLDRISGLAVDPNTNRALFSVRATDLENNKGVRSIWMKDISRVKDPEIRLAISDKGAVNTKWSHDGQSIFFLSVEGGSMNLWRSDAQGNNAVQVTSLPLDVNAYRLTPDGLGAVVALAVFPSSTEDEIARTTRMNSEKKLGSGTVYDRLFVRHWDSWADGTRNHLFHVEFASGKTTALTPGYDGDIPSMPFGDEADFVLGPDGRTVYFSAREAGRTEPWSTNFDIYSVAISGGAIKDLTEPNKAWDAHPRISPDGRTLAYKAMERPGFEADRFELRLLDIATGVVTTLAEDWDRSVDEIKWAKDAKSLFVTADDLGRHRLFQVMIQATGKSTVFPLSGAGHIDDFVETPKRMVFLKSSLNGPSTLYMSEICEGVQNDRKRKAPIYVDACPTNLTKVNASLNEKQFGEFEQFNFKGWNDGTVHGYVIKPAKYVEGKKYPVAFLIHGGPQGSFGDGWSFRWNPQSYAGAGYAVVMIDFHGSTGYGQKFTDAISDHWGDRPLEDLQKGWKYALEKYPFLDGDRAAALGASYGGFMVNWIAGNWKEPWKCLVSHNGVFDSRMMGYSTEELWFTTWEAGGVDVYTNPAKYDEFNPALHVNKWSVPLLVIHSDKDYRIPLDQGIAAFTAAQAKGVDSQFLRFPDENHWVLKPQNSMQWHKTVFDWLDAHIGDRK